MSHSAAPWGRDTSHWALAKSSPGARLFVHGIRLGLLLNLIIYIIEKTAVVPIANTAKYSQLLSTKAMIRAFLGPAPYQVPACSGQTHILLHTADTTGSRAVFYVRRGHGRRLLRRKADTAFLCRDPLCTLQPCIALDSSSLAKLFSCRSDHDSPMQHWRVQRYGAARQTRVLADDYRRGVADHAEDGRRRQNPARSVQSAAPRSPFVDYPHGACRHRCP